MDKFTGGLGTAESNLCTEPFLLGELKAGKSDKLGNKILELLWFGRNYAIYRSAKGVHVHFSDCLEEEKEQRERFTAICPELCELRYLTSKMRSNLFGWRGRFDQSSLYDHNIAQAVMLTMENHVEPAREIAKHALIMAAQRATNDNKLIYVRAAVICWIVFIITGIIFYHYSTSELWPYVVAAMAGGTGALFSIATRLQEFELRPCDQSNMNKWMSMIRIGVGVIAGASVLILLCFSDAVKQPSSAIAPIPWTVATFLGLIGGFAERLVPSLFRRAVETIESGGTPVLAARAKEKDKPIEGRPASQKSPAGASELMGAQL
jgi:hypothetical protein